MKSLFFQSFVLCAFVFSFQSHAQVPLSLQNALDAFDRIDADFQLEIKENGQALETQNGHFSLLRPRYLEYQDQEQRIVSDGRFVFYYFPDLQQALKRNFEDVAPEIPLFALTENQAMLFERYTITQENPKSFTLTSPQETIKTIKLTLNASGMIDSIFLEYGGNAATEFTLLNIKKSKRTRKDFQFTAPEGTSILE